MQQQPNIIREIDRVYATALVEMAADAGRLEEVADEVKQLIEGLGDQTDFSRLLGAPTLAVEERAAIIERVFKGRVHDLVFSFLMVVNRKGRHELFPGVFHAFLDIYDERHGVIEVDAYSAHAMTELQKAQITSSLSESIGRQVVVREHVDASLIGGVKLRIGDQLIDGTVVHQLRQLRDELIEAGRQDARERLSALTA